MKDENAEFIKGTMKKLPGVDEIKERLCINLREARLLRQLLKLAEQKQRVEEARNS